MNLFKPRWKDVLVTLADMTLLSMNEWERLSNTETYSLDADRPELQQALDE